MPKLIAHASTPVRQTLTTSPSLVVDAISGGGTATAPIRPKIASAATVAICTPAYRRR